jgi:hypothetical protein
MLKNLKIYKNIKYIKIQNIIKADGFVQVIRDLYADGVYNTP